MKIYFNPYPAPTENEHEGIECFFSAADALSRLKNVTNVTAASEETSPPSNFVLVRDRDTCALHTIPSILHKTNGERLNKMKLLIQLFSRGEYIDADSLITMAGWRVRGIDMDVPLLEHAARNNAISLTIPTAPCWSVDCFHFDGQDKLVHNVWGQHDLSSIHEHCIQSLDNAQNRFAVKFSASYCTGALNDAPREKYWDQLGFFSHMGRAQRRNFQEDGTLTKKAGQKNTKKHGSLLELRLPGWRIFFVKKAGADNEIIIGGFYKKNSGNQTVEINKAIDRIDSYVL